MPDFYVLFEADYESKKALRLTVARGDKTRSQLLRGVFPPEPIGASKHLGSKPVDYTDMSLTVVSAAFRDAVMRHGLTGTVFAALSAADVEGEWFLMVQQASVLSMSLPRSPEVSRGRHAYEASRSIPGAGPVMTSWYHRVLTR